MRRQAGALCAFAAVATVCGWLWVYRGAGAYDLDIYLRAGQLVRAGQSPMLEAEWLYPPAALLPYLLPVEWAAPVHWAGMVAAAGVVGWEGGTRAGRWWPVVVAAIMFTPPLQHSVGTGNISLMVAALTLLGLRARRPWLAGALVGLAAACKLLPAIVLLAWWRRPERWRVWGWAIAVGLGSLLLPGGGEWVAAGGPLVAMEMGPELAHKVWSLPPVLRPVAGLLAVGLCALGPAWAPLGLAVAPWATGLPWAHAMAVGLAGWPRWEPASTERRAGIAGPRRWRWPWGRWPRCERRRR